MMLKDIYPEKKNRALLILVSAIAVLFLILLLFLFFAFPEMQILGPTVAVIPIKGEISFEQSLFSETLTADEIIAQIELAENDPSVSAILLEINSGGGEIVATKQIVAKLKKTKKPTVSWISSAGASGAYYIAAASDYIVADADSITGSIGVISVFPNYKDLLEKWGIKMIVLKEGQFKDMGSPFSDLNAAEAELFQKLISDSFVNFKSDLLELRAEKINKKAFEKIADGRILSGKQALEIGMIDSLGTKDDAVLKTAELTGFKGKTILKYYYATKSDLTSFLGMAGYSFGRGFKEGLTTSSVPSIES